MILNCFVLQSVHRNHFFRNHNFNIGISTQPNLLRALLPLFLYCYCCCLQPSLALSISTTMSARATTASTTTQGLLRVLGVRTAKVTYPTGNPNFAVKQSFPAGFDETESDPFLMCDYFGPSRSNGIEQDPDRFQVGWHPHRGMDICTYLKEGIGRHADSLGNRELFHTPGMQWISVGSGIEHAEGGGTPAGQNMTGFQIWINVPAKHKMDDPQYGTVDPKDLPLLSLGDIANKESIQLRLLAGHLNGERGPFLTKQPLQMFDLTMHGGKAYQHNVPLEMDNCLVYVYDGSGKVNGQSLSTHSVVRLDAGRGSDENTRGLVLEAGSSGMSAMVFAGKRINEPIAWQGPFVMNTQEELQKTMLECRRGQFPPKRVPWDYRKFASFPKNEQEKIRQQQQFQMQQCNSPSGSSSTVSMDKTQCL